MEVPITDTQRMIRDTIRSYLDKEVGPLVDELETGRLLPYEPIRKVASELGMLDSDGEMRTLMQEGSPEDCLPIFIPRMFMIELARVSAGLAATWGGAKGLVGATLQARGTPEQRERWARPVLNLEKVGAWGITEPQGGSAPFRDMKTRARRDGDQFVLNGTKTFISSAPYADVFVIFAKLKENGTERVASFIVERDDPGIETGPPMEKMGLKSCPTGEVYLNDCRIPVDRVLGSGKKQSREAGVDKTRSWLSNERWGLAVISYGIMERAFEIAVDYARDRVVGGSPIGQYQLIQRRLARMYLALINSHSFIWSDVIAGRKLTANPADNSMGKTYMAECATYMANEAIYVLGGFGYLKDGVVERLARDAKILELGGGTTEMQELTAGRWIVEHYGR